MTEAEFKEQQDIVDVSVAEVTLLARLLGRDVSAALLAPILSCLASAAQSLTKEELLALLKYLVQMLPPAPQKREEEWEGNFWKRMLSEALARQRAEQTAVSGRNISISDQNPKG